MKHIRLYFISLVFACCMFMVCPFAFADEYLQSDYDLLPDIVSDHFGVSFVQYIPQSSEVAGFVYYETLDYYFLDIVPVSNTGINSTPETNASQFWLCGNGMGYYNGGSNWYQIAYLYSSSPVSFSAPVYAYRFVKSKNDGSNYAVVKLPVIDALQSQWNQRSMYYYKGNNNQNGNQGRTFLAQSSISFNNNISFSSDYTTFLSNDVIYYLSTGDIMLSYSSVSRNIPSYTEDSRLQFAIVDNIYGGKNLMTDIRQFVNDFPIQDTSHSSVNLYPESITLTFIVDNVEKTITLSSSNSTIKSKYIFETDLSNFDFDDSAENVIITKCDFTISGSTQGGQTETENYKISCDYYIKRFVEPIEQGSNPYESNLDGEPTSQETKDSLQYLVTFREGYGLDFDEFSDLSFPDYYTYADVYLYNNSAAYNYLIDNILSVNAVAYIIQNIANTEDDVITQIGLFLDDSNYGEYYDVIVFDWIQETSSTYTHTYFYFETVSGRVKASTQFLQVIQDDLNKVKVNTAAAFTAIDNFESESIQFFNAKLGLDADLLGWVKTIDNSINNLDFPVYDDSNIVTLLGQIKDLLASPANEIDTPQECIQLYEAHPNYFDELWGTPTPALRSASVTPSSNNPYISSDFVRADLVPAWWEGKTLTMIYILKNDGETSRFYNDILNGLFDSYENLIESDNSFNTYIDSLFKTGYDYTDSFYGHMFDLNYNPEAWDGGFADNE